MVGAQQEPRAKQIVPKLVGESRNGQELSSHHTVFEPDSVTWTLFRLAPGTWLLLPLLHLHPIWGQMVVSLEERLT